jgi:hypothetical protein
MTQVIHVLEEFPKKITELEDKVAHERAKLDLAKAEEDLAEAEATLRFQDAKNQTLLNAKVTSDPQVKEKRKARIDAQENYEVAQAYFHQAENAFASARKLASIGVTASDIEEMS